MVARTPPKQNKVDRCMARLQELQYTVAGGTKVVSGVSLSPRSTRAYLRTSLRCKQESLRIKNGAPRRSPQGKFPRPNTLEGEWRQMSLPAMLVGETLGEILHASQFAREIVSAVARKTSTNDPKTPLPQQRSSQKKLHSENTELKARRKKEKQIKQQSDSPPSLQRARSRINFKVSPPKIREFDKENNKHLANRVSPRNRPWARKTVLFPNPLFTSTTSSSVQQQFCKTKSPIVSRNKGTPQHKFLIKSSSPPSAASKFQVKVQKSPPIVSIYSSTRATSLSKNSPKKSAASKSSRPFSPSRLVTRLASPLRSKKTVQKSDSLSKNSPKRSSASKFQRSFSPSRLATRLVSPLKSKKNVQQSHGFVSGLKQRPESTMLIPARRI
ncbi:hypothetical protein TanjilG_22613 [Lupinus angustifolius]|uniref:Microtubule-binding protein TANGLED n=1 Tax=Lupinus angustifolius TaxID=3871 RepID=A0A4P1RT39_LUPAN|nr:hypothetical protein TanjilG_22613 [Lupinus angustifolius]